MPSSLAVSPLLIPAARNTADSDAIRMSAARLRQKPPPMAGPLTAAITGWCILRMARTTSSRIPRARRAMVGRVRPSMWGIVPGSSRSAPEQKPFPAPVSTTTRVSLSTLTSSIASRNGIITSNAIAFIRSGRLSVINVTWGRGLSTTTNDMAGSLARPRLQVVRGLVVGLVEHHRVGAGDVQHRREAEASVHHGRGEGGALLFEVGLRRLDV